MNDGVPVKEEDVPYLKIHGITHSCLFTTSDTALHPLPFLAHAGLKDGMPVKEEDVPCLISIVQQGLAPDATKEMVSSAIASRPERAAAYA